MSLQRLLGLSPCSKSIVDCPPRPSESEFSFSMRYLHVKQSASLLMLVLFAASTSMTTHSSRCNCTRERCDKALEARCHCLQLI